MSITFIIPCYNCEKIIFRNFLKINKFIKLHKLKTKIIFINDGSKDNTLKVLNKIKNKSISIINNKTNLGKSKSIINCLKLVNTKYVVLIDCDLSYFRYLKDVTNSLRNNDLICVNRRLAKSKSLEKDYNLYQISRNLISNILGNIIEKKLKLGVKGDTQAGLKAFKFFKDFKKKKFISQYYFFDIELINFFKQKNLKIKLIPVKYKISRRSSIKFFSMKNFYILLEFYKVLLKN